VGVLTVIGFTAGLWLIYSAVREPVSRLRHRQTLSAAVLGMSIAHFGVGLFTIGVTAVESYKIERDLVMRPGDATEIAGYRFAFASLRNVTGPNYDAVEGEFSITRGADTIAVLHPQKRTYRVQTSPMTEAGISVGWTRDLFVALGDDVGDGAWSIRLQYKPLIRYIWLGAWIMALGGLVATTDRRYRLKHATEQAPATGAMARESG
jgi:cytochrome c-type biogenesis protein CcmF